MKTFEQLFMEKIQAHFGDILKNEAPRTLTEKELLEVILQNYRSVTSKSHMLKALRAMGYKVAQSRCYKMYSDVERVWRESEVEAYNTKFREDNMRAHKENSSTFDTDIIPDTQQIEYIEAEIEYSENQVSMEVDNSEAVLDSFLERKESKLDRFKRFFSKGITPDETVVPQLPQNPSKEEQKPTKKRRGRPRGSKNKKK